MKPHPAKYSNAFMHIFESQLKMCRRILDPFGGTGKLHNISTVGQIVCLEIEPDWATDLVGNALYLPFADNAFDGVCTSPCYGNRMADHHNAKDGSKRFTYTHMIGHTLHPDNAGAMHFGHKYKAFHIHAWTEIKRVLAPGGRFILNVSDYIQQGHVVEVSKWHLNILVELGFALKDTRAITTPRSRMGSNDRTRVEFEYIFIFDLVK